MSETTSSDLQRACDLAASLHAGQFRDGKPPVPYVSHPFDVMTRLRLAGIRDLNMLTAAMLHDVAEETTATLEDVRAEFGKEVAALVGELTRHEPSTEGLTTEEAYALRTETMLKEVSQMSAKAQAVKLADRCSNLAEAILVRSPKKLGRYVGQTEAILAIIPRKVAPLLYDELKRLIQLAKAA